LRVSCFDVPGAGAVGAEPDRVVPVGAGAGVLFEPQESSAAAASHAAMRNRILNMLTDG
jgi:hypothetical protein